MNKALSKLLATVLITAMILGFLPAAMFRATAAPQSVPVATAPAPCLFLVGSVTNQGLDFYTSGVNATVGGTFTVTAWINTTADEGGWVGAFTFNATQIHCMSVAFVANSSSQSSWFFDNTYYAPGTGTPPFLDSVTPPSAPDNVAGTIGEPSGFGEVLLGISVLPATAPFVEELITMTFQWQAGAFSSLPAIGTIAWDPSVAFIVNTGGSQDFATAYGNYNYQIALPPPPPPQMPYVKITPETSTTFATITGPTGYDLNNEVGTSFYEDVTIPNWNAVNATVEVDYSNTTLLTVTNVTYGADWTGTPAIVSPGVITLFAANNTNSPGTFAVIGFQILTQEIIPPYPMGYYDDSNMVVNSGTTVLYNTTGIVTRAADVNAPDVQVYGFLSVIPAQFVVQPPLTIEGPNPCVGNTFVVNVTLNPGKSNNVIGAQFVLQYNSTLMAPLSVAEGPFFPEWAAAANNGENTFLSTSINSNIGTWGPNVLFADIILPNETNGGWMPPFANASDVIAEITFQCLYQPPTGSITSPLTILNDPSASFIVGLDGMGNIVYPIMLAPINALYEVTTPAWQVGRMIDEYGGAVNSGHGYLLTGTDSPFPVTEGNDWAFPAPYGGQGANMPMDMVEPQSFVYFNAYVSYNGWPVQSKNVAFEITEPDGSLYMKTSAITDSDGIATIGIRMPWPCDPNQDAALLGKWNEVSTVELADVVINDTLNFKYDYIIHITSVTTDMSMYNHGDTVTVYFNFTSYFMQQFPISLPFPVLIEVSIIDNLGVTVGTATYTTTVGGAVFCTYSQYSGSVQITIPKWAYAGIATINVAGFDGLEPVAGGVAITPLYVGPTILIMPA
ncbi:MAG: cohesin domain-containing protein [Candidatus Bathyarchaeia archaeon]